MADMTKNEPEIVPGMAETIEARRRQLQLSPGEFSRRAGITRQGLAPVVKGHRRAYQDRVRFGVARALEWEPDAIDRLLAGEQPVEITGVVIGHGGGGARGSVGTYSVEEARARLREVFDGIDDETI